MAEPVQPVARRVRAIPEEKARLLVRHGVGRAWHGRSLEDVPGAGPLLAWLRDGAAVAEVDAGRGWTLTGGSAGYDATVLLCKSLFFRGRGVDFVRLAGLVGHVRRGTERLEELAEVRVLAVADLYSPWGRERSCPWDGATMREVEDFLDARLDAGLALVAHFAAPCPPGEWWSEPFLSRLGRTNRGLSL